MEKLLRQKDVGPNKRKETKQNIDKSWRQTCIYNAK